MKKKFVLLILLIFTLSSNVFAESKPTGCELSEEYKKWLAIPESERSKISMPELCKKKDLPNLLYNYGIPTFSEVVEQSNIPSNFDLRNVDGNNYVTSVKDQKSTGTCWNHASIAAVESSVLKEIGPSNIFDFSEIHMAYTGSYNYFTDGNNLEARTNRIVGEGGHYMDSSSYFVKLKGPILENDFSFDMYYDSTNQLSENNYTKKISLNEIEDKTVMADVNNIVWFQYDKCTTDALINIKKYIKENGALQAAYYRSNSYTNGFYSYYNGSNESNHTVEIIGWDDTISKTKFKSGAQPTTDGAFIIKNSWGANSGDNGYYYISYEDKHICRYLAAYNDVDLDVEDNVYYHDKLGHWSGYGWGNNEYTAWAANKFTKKSLNEEVLTEVTIGTRYNTDYEIYISFADENNEIDLNNRKLIGVGNINHKGYGTHKFDEPIIIEKDFSIIVKYTSADLVDGWPIAVQDSTVSGCEETSIGENKSFVSLEGEYWFDNSEGWTDENGIRQYSIPSIKAYTNNIDYDFSIGEVTKNDVTKDKFNIPITVTNITNQSDKNFSIKIMDSNEVDVTDEFTINDYIKANNYVEIEKKSLDTENGEYKVEISYDLLTYDTTIEVTNSVPIRDLFVDNEFYKCVIDSFNTGKTNAEKVDYSHSLSQEELHTIENLTCSGYTGQWQASKITSISGIELLTKLKTMDLSYMDLNNEEYVNDYILDLTDFNNLTSVKLKFTRIGKVIIGDKKDLNTIEFLNAGPSEIELGELPNLTNLIIEGGIINEINVSESPKLQTLSMINTQNISNINLSNNLELLKLNLEGNNISNIDISNNDKLIELRLNNNILTNINLNSNINLSKLVLNDNEISNIDLSKNSELKYLMLDNNSLNSINLNNNSKLEELHIDNNNLTQLNLESLASLNDLFADDNKLETITFADGLGRISLNNNNLTNIDFGENNLCSLYISNNNIENLDTSKMQCLEVLSASDNKIKSINLENNINLTNLSLNNNEINELDVTKNTKLTLLRLKNNIGLKKVYVNDIKQLDFEIGTKDKVVGYRNIKKDIAENNIIDSKETYNIKQIEAYYKDGYYYDDYPVILTDTNVTINNIGLVENARYVIPYLNSNNSVNGELELNYDYYVLNLTSETYEVNNEESYINIGEEKISNDIKNDLNLNYGDMELKNNKLQILFEDNLIKEFDIISDYKEKSMTLTKPILTPETIYDYIGGKVNLTASLQNINVDSVQVDVYKEGTESIINQNFDVNENSAEIELTIPKDTVEGTYKIKVSAGGCEAVEEFLVTKYIRVSTIELGRNLLELLKGETGNLTVTVFPKDANNKNVKWTSSDETVAKVDQNGKVTAVGRGTATITVTSDDKGKTDDCEVIVKEPYVTLGEIKISSNYNNLLYKGYGGNISVPITRQDISSDELINLEFYKKDNEDFKQITDVNVINQIHNSKINHENNNSTLIFDISPSLEIGEYKVNMSYNNSNTESFTFKVLEEVLVTNIEISDIKLPLDNNYHKINYKILPENATNKKVEIITESNLNKIDLSGEYIKGVELGTTTLTIKSLDGSNIEKTINVEVVEKSISLTDNEIIPKYIYSENNSDKLYDIDGGIIKTKLTVSNIDEENFKYSLIKTDDNNSINIIDKITVNKNSSNNELVLNIEPNILKDGKYKFKVLASEGIESNEITFTINKYIPVENVDIKYNNQSIKSLNLIVGRENLEVNGIINETATNKQVEWILNNDNCSISDDNSHGIFLNAEKVGQCQITFKSKEKHNSEANLEKSIIINVIDGNSIVNDSLHQSNIYNEFVDVKYGGTITNAIQFNNLKEDSDLLVEVYDGSKLLGMDYVEKDVMVLNNMLGTISLNIKPDKFNYLNEFTPSKELTVKYTYTLNDIDDTEITKEYKVNLSEYNPITKINLSKTDIKLDVNETYSIRSIFRFEPSNATNYEVTLSSNNTNVAIIDGYSIKALSEGTAKITVTSQENESIKATINLTVEKNDYVKFDKKINIHNESGSKYLKGFNTNNTYKDLINNIDTNMNVVLKESNGTKVTSNSSVLKTGMKLSVGNNTYDIVIKGDMSGDGKMSITDLSQMRYHLAQAKGKVKSGAYKQAGDMNDSNSVTITDLSQMRKKLAGGN